MNVKEKLADAHNNFPIIDSHPAALYAEALNAIVELEELNREMHVQVSGYLKGDEWTHWQKFNETRFKI